MSGCTMLRSYVVRVDHGFAPNPYGGILTLTCCKPRIRKVAQVGSWVLGTHRTGVNSKAVCFLGQVSEALDLDAYARDPRFKEKDSSPHGAGDRIYVRNAGGHLVQLRNRRHGPEHFADDTSVDRMLVMNKFWYFGDNIQELPPHIVPSVVKSNQGHKNISDISIINELEKWATQFQPGVIGAPLDQQDKSCRKKKRCQSSRRTPTCSKTSFANDQRSTGTGRCG